MAEGGNVIGARPFGLPLGRGIALFALCFSALVYAWIAVPLTLIPAGGVQTRLDTVAGNDFLAFYAAAKLAWAHAAQEAYRLPHLFAVEAGVSGLEVVRLPFTYPPLFLLYAAPLAALAYLPALYIWLFATTAPFALIARRLSGLAAPLIALSPPVVQNAIDGQNGALTASLFTGGLALLTGKRPILAGLCFAFLAYKPQTFVLIPICLLAARQYRALAATVIAGAVLALVSFAAFGLETWKSFLDLLPQQVAFVLDNRLPTTRFPTVFALVHHATGQAIWANAAQGVATLLAMTLAAWAWRRTEAVLPRALAFAAALPLSTPYLLEYDLAVWALPAAMLMVLIWRGAAAPADWIGLVLLWTSPPLIFVLGRAGFHMAAVAPLSLAVYAVWRIRREPHGAHCSGEPAET